MQPRRGLSPGPDHAGARILVSSLWDGEKWLLLKSSIYSDLLEEPEPRHDIWRNMHMIKYINEQTFPEWVDVQISYLILHKDITVYFSWLIWSQSIQFIYKYYCTSNIMNTVINILLSRILSPNKLFSSS